MLIRMGFSFRPLEKALPLVCIFWGAIEPFFAPQMTNLILTNAQCRPPMLDPCRYQLLQPLGGALGALGAHAPDGGAHRVPLPEHSCEELPLGRW